MRFRDEDYAELLALYLGDGCIPLGPRTFRLRLALDKKYPMVIADARDLVTTCFPENRVDIVPLKGCVNVSIYCQHLPCLFPQHGSGKKHARPIVLEDWQLEIVNRAPWPFTKGCIRTDGCAFINRTDIHQERPDEYLSYEFSNLSTDITELFIAACDRVGVFTRANRDARGRWSVRINRRASIALMLEHVGVKK